MDERSTFLCLYCETVVTVNQNPDNTWNARCPNVTCRAEFSKEQIHQIFAGSTRNSAAEQRAAPSPHNYMAEDMAEKLVQHETENGSETETPQEAKAEIPSEPQAEDVAEEIAQQGTENGSETEMPQEAKADVPSEPQAEDVAEEVVQHATKNDSETAAPQEAKADVPSEPQALAAVNVADLKELTAEIAALRREMAALAKRLPSDKAGHSGAVAKKTASKAPVRAAKKKKGSGR
jgi:chemotaxis protein histidine kinase CheA